MLFRSPCRSILITARYKGVCSCFETPSGSAFGVGELAISSTLSCRFLGDPQCSLPSRTRVCTVSICPTAHWVAGSLSSRVDLHRILGSCSLRLRCVRSFLALKLITVVNPNPFRLQWRGRWCRQSALLPVALRNHQRRRHSEQKQVQRHLRQRGLRFASRGVLRCDFFSPIVVLRRS